MDQVSKRTGFCECGCGKKTNIAIWTNRGLGRFKGKPMRFIQYHQLKGENSPRYLGDKRRLDKGGHLLKKCHGHPRADKNGYVFDHILIAEKALGKPILRIHHIHHFPKAPSGQLIICQNQAYHSLLHRRYRSLMACGNPDFRKCPFCKKYDDIKNLYMINKKTHPSFMHLTCWHIYTKKKRKKKEPVVE